MPWDVPEQPFLGLRAPNGPASAMPVVRVFFSMLESWATRRAAFA